jgi:S-adenosylmethionine-diacylgycerolhomoserine-N-methlytransferase
MIPEWQAALDQGCRILAPGGSLHVVDFGQQERLPRWFGKAFRAYLAQFHVTARADLFQVGAELAGRHGLALQADQPFRDYTRMMVLRRP